MASSDLTEGEADNLNAIIAKELFGWSRREDKWYPSGRSKQPQHLPRFHADRQLADKAADQLARDFAVRINVRPQSTTPDWFVEAYWMDGSGQTASEWADTEAKIPLSMARLIARVVLQPLQDAGETGFQ